MEAFFFNFTAVDVEYDKVCALISHATLAYVGHIPKHQQPSIPIVLGLFYFVYHGRHFLQSWSSNIRYWF